MTLLIEKDTRYKRHEETFTFDEPGEITMASIGSSESTCEVWHDEVLEATMTEDNPTYTVEAPGDYLLKVWGPCDEVKVYFDTTAACDIKGEPGKDGEDGEDGKNAYEVFVENGFTGTEKEWEASLKGDKGDPMTYSDMTDTEKEELAAAVAAEIEWNQQSWS